ncbi:hypothetical protein Tco_0136053 [Tanacetum coccineum]
MDEEVRESYRRFESRLFHEGRFVTSYFIEANNMLPTFQAIGLESFLTLDEPICPRFLDTSQLSRIFQTPKALETFYTSKWSLDSLDDHPNSRFFGPKHDLNFKETPTNSM